MGDILVVDDEKDICELVSDILVDEGYTTRKAANSDEAFGEINKDAPDLIILDIWLKESKLDGIDILKTVRRDNPDIPVVIISGHGNIEIAVAAVKQGAYDFIEKPFNIDQLMVVIARAMETSRLRRENAQLKVRDVTSSVMVGNSAAFRNLQSQLDKVTKTNGRVMLTGPSGCGKEVAARYIHSKSDRAKAPFVSVNSASIEPDRMEEVLFGREGGERGFEPGLLEQAHGGIVFFDEVADMPIGTQSKILRVLVEQSFTRVGGADKVRVDIRVLSATNRDLVQEIAAGNFREELYHRLNVVPITVPSLEARREDIAMLAEHFMEELNSAQGLPVRPLAEETEALLQTMSWPGNVRQLRNVIERVLILGPEKGEIEPSEIPGNESSGGGDSAGLSNSYATLPLREAREMFEREYLMAQINRFGGNISRTANFVGMERSALHRKLKTLNVVTTNKAGTRIAEIDDNGERDEDA
ncbi:sigma-54 dependent transcriptional regulator [Amylibacter sp. IMCC11727]|uniref:nitrogen assimilation response regulator NtrX n=1 Tax=Amylibacter sp. IMCC11727 TaxID=3039851 RepID=UPI00244E2414|nr:sigma-54 dependent transcriptional regulator [Amylibacter sp. IMCC11727]WGI20348.1 sigma-54 dependent transcriptional regulator [Amylibacter sp. IMCC11727]